MISKKYEFRIRGEEDQSQSLDQRIVRSLQLCDCMADVDETFEVFEIGLGLKQPATKDTAFIGMSLETKVLYLLAAVETKKGGDKIDHIGAAFTFDDWESRYKTTAVKLLGQEPTTEIVG